MPTKKKFLFAIIPFILFGIVISFNFSKPFGFFRETNPAMVCINALQWSQYPAMHAMHIPIVTYGFNGNANPPSQLYNTITTFGYAWFSVPYYFFKTLHLTPNEISIRIFSLLWLLFTLATIFLLTRQLTIYHLNAAKIKYFTLLLYLFSPVILWYHVQGYVHEIAVLPFYFLSWLFFAKYVNNPARTIQLFACSFFLLVAVQFDWLPVFQAGIMSLYLLSQRKKLGTIKTFYLPVLSILLGTAYIYITYENWIGQNEYLSFLESKFLNRTVGGGGLRIFPWLNHNLNILIFYITGFGLLLLLFVLGIIKKQGTNIVILLMVASAVMHHLVFWGFSTEHDHGVLKMAMPIAFVSAVCISQIQKTKKWLIIVTILISGIGIYSYLHNFFNRPGMYSNTNFCFTIGNYVKKNVPSNGTVVFINTEYKYFPQIEFYAGRAYTMASSEQEAIQLLKELFPGKVGFFINTDAGEVSGIKILD